MPIDTIAEDHVEEDSKLNEYDLYRERLHTVEDNASEGLYGGEALYFLGSVEREVHIITGTEFPAVLASGVYDQDALDKAVQETDMLLPEDFSSFVVMNEADRKAQDEEYRQKAREYVEALHAETGEEEAKKSEWLANVDSFTTSDIINFRLYLEFSEPTLGETAPPKLLDHAAMHDYADQSGWLEFRFGNSAFQAGYYDNTNVTEFRLTPCSPSVLIEREEIIQKRLLEIAAEHGAMVSNGGSHINLSAYTHQADELRWTPLIGREPERQEKTMAVVSGLTAAIEDGAWMRHAVASDRFLFGEMAGGPKWLITTNRNSIRLQDDYLELREPVLKESTAHGLLWMMAGISYGLEQGTTGIAAEGHTTAELEDRVVAERTERFDKNVDLQLQRALEQSELSEHGFFILNGNAMVHRGPELAQAVTGNAELGDSTEGGIFAKVFMVALNVDQEGRLSFDRDAYAQCVAQLPELYRQLCPNLDMLVQPDIIDAAENFVARDAVRVDIKSVVRAHSNYPGRTPEEWEQLWAQSPIVQRMYGDAAERYGHEVFTTAAEHYTPVDLSTEESRAAVLGELAARAQRRHQLGR